MKTDEKAMAAILAVFPNHNAFATFAEDETNSRSLESFIHYAFESKVIDEPHVKRFEAFIRTHAKPPYECTPPHGLNFDVLLERKKSS